MNLYRVGVCLEEGAVVIVKANDESEAKDKAHELLDRYGSAPYPTKYKPDVVHREYMVTDISCLPKDES